jgi:hypothetical protein
MKSFGTEAGFLRVLRFPLSIIIPPTAPHPSSTISQGWYNRPISSQLIKWTQSHPTRRNKNISRTCIRSWERWTSHTEFQSDHLKSRGDLRDRRDERIIFKSILKTLVDGVQIGLNWIMIGASSYKRGNESNEVLAWVNFWKTVPWGISLWVN